jgi:hypothetical protein
LEHKHQCQIDMELFIVPKYWKYPFKKIYNCLSNKIVRTLLKFMIPQCADRALQTLVEGSNNSAGRWICRYWFLYRQPTELLRVEKRRFMQGV